MLNFVVDAFCVLVTLTGQDHAKCSFAASGGSEQVGMQEWVVEQFLLVLSGLDTFQYDS